MTYTAIRRRIAQRESLALRTWPPNHWPHIHTDTQAHINLCVAHGYYVPVNGYNLPDPDREHRRQIERESKRRTRRTT